MNSIRDHMNIIRGFEIILFEAWICIWWTSDWFRFSFWI